MPLSAQETSGWQAFSDYWTKTDAEASNHLKPKTSFRMGLGLNTLAAGAALNTPFTLVDVLGNKDNDWKKNGICDLDFTKLAKDNVLSKNGLDLNVALQLHLFDLAIQGKQEDGSFKEWGWGLSIADVYGSLDVGFTPGLIKLIGQGNVGQDRLEAGLNVSGAVFAETVGFNWHTENFILPKLYVKFTGGHFIPVFYIPNSGVDVYIDTRGNGTVLGVDGSINGYTAIAFDSNNKPTGLSSYGGFDISAQAEYNFFSMLDVGITIDNIPLVPAHMTTVMTMNMSQDILNTSDLLHGGGMGGFDSLFDNIKPEFANNGDKWVTRPMRWDVYALYRPLLTDFLVLRPHIGFTSLTPAEVGYFNFGVEASLNVGDWFTFAYYTGGYDGICRNRFTLNFNWKVLPIFFSIETRSQDYWRAWTLDGALITLGGAMAF
jgi:hypothetical protein